MKRFGAFLGRLACALGAAAILLLGLGPILGPGDSDFPGGFLGIAVLALLALGGVITGFLMLRCLTPDRTTRRLLTAGASAPVVLAVLFVAAASGVNRVSDYEVLVGLLILCWTGYAALIALVGLRLRLAGEARAAGLLLCGAGAALLLQSVGGAGGLLFGPDRAWPDLLIQGGITVSAGFAAALLATMAFAREGRCR